MKILRSLAVLPLFAAACCAPVPKSMPNSVPAPQPVVTPPVTPLAGTPVPMSLPMEGNWADAPQTPGDWQYQDAAGLSFATFSEAGQPARFGIECQKSARTVRLVRGASTSSPSPMRILTETTERLVTATPDDNGRPMLIVSVLARDNLLDAIALSRGRFAVETGGMETLYLPSWPEISRVIEDCR